MFWTQEEIAAAKQEEEARLARIGELLDQAVAVATRNWFGEYAFDVLVEEIDRRRLMQMPISPEKQPVRRVPIPDSLRWEVWEDDDFTCQGCGVRRGLTIDHIVPVAKGGTNDRSNLQTLCGSCNSGKGAR